MRLKPTNQFKPWTLDELSTLKHLIEEGTPPRLMAKELSRTVEVLDYMMRVEKLSLKAQRRP